MPCYSIADWTPQIHPSAYIAPTAQVVGNVVIDANSSVWFQTVIRGDNASPIRIGCETNIQDLAMLHSDPDAPLTLGARVTVAHKVVLHGCTVSDDCLIGIGAIVLNGVVLGEGCLVGAGALVTEGKIFAPRSLVLGNPAKRVGDVTPEHFARIQHASSHYVKNGEFFARGLLLLTEKYHPQTND